MAKQIQIGCEGVVGWFQAGTTIFEILRLQAQASQPGLEIGLSRRLAGQYAIDPRDGERKRQHHRQSATRNPPRSLPVEKFVPPSHSRDQGAKPRPDQRGVKPFPAPRLGQRRR